MTDDKWGTHEAYIDAVARALDGAGFKSGDSHADDNDPRDGAIELDLDRQGTIDGKPIWPHDEVWVGWSEDRGWHLLTVDDPHGRNSRFVYELGLVRVASPWSVVMAVAEKAGLTLELPDDGHPDADFPEHTCEEDTPAFEAALRRYREGTR
jgi:hypothetical protein